MSRHRGKTVWLILLLAMLVAPARGQDGLDNLLELPKFELKDDDRVVFLGSEFTEQAIKHNYFEAELTARWPDRRVKFFNMGWSGDTPAGIARGYFGGADEGFKRLVAELDRIKPTVIFLCYGSNFEGKTTGPFAEALNKLYLKCRTYTKRTIMISPPPAERRQPPWPSYRTLNARRRAATRTKQQMFQREQDATFFVNLFGSLERRLATGRAPLTVDGIRFTADGYKLITNLMLKILRVEETKAREGLSDENFDKLRELIREKNDLYFHRYRPQNETYLRGFRKHEQGQNAKEIAQFDALIEKAENRIYAFLNGQPLPDAIPEPPPIALSFEAMTPEKQRETFTVADGLQVSLFASEPLIANPIHMQFDGQGRLWVATSPIYPHIKPGAKPRDEIIILEDTDGDGGADKKTVFAKDLLIPTAVLPDEKGGAYVANSTELLHLTDTDGDGKADKRRVVFAGFGTEDTHHILHTFRWGPDAAIYFNQSIYIHTHMETPAGVRRLLGSGIWRYVPETGTAEVVMRGLVNPWGHSFDDYGQSFATDGAGGNGINYAFVGAAFQSAVGYSRVLPGLNPGQPKHCGLEIITGTHWPDDWQGTLVTNDFRGNRINRFQLEGQGSGYVSTQMPDVLSSSHRAFRPVDLKMGPDGTLYVADWYNPIINHGEVDFRDSRRDYKHGRIWRVSVKDRERTNPPKFAEATVPELLDMLKLPEQRTRHMARVELKKRGGYKVSSDLDKWTDELAEDDLAGRLESLWTHEATRRIDQPLLYGLLECNDHRYRAAAVRVLGHYGDRIKGWEERLIAAAQDEHPQVRLESLAAIRAKPSRRAAEMAMLVMDQPMDKNVDFALWVTMRELEEHWLPTMETDTPVDFASNPAKALFALRAVGKSNVAAPLVKLLESDSLSDKDWSDMVALVGDFGEPEHLDKLLDIAVTDAARRDTALAALITAAQKRKVKPSGELNRLIKLSDSGSALHLAGLWNLATMKNQIQQAALTGQGRQRYGAIRALAAMKDAETLTQVIDGENPTNVRRGAISRLLDVDARTAASKASKFLGDLPADEAIEATRLIGAFVSRRKGPSILAEALREVRLNEAVATAGLRRASSAGRNGRILVDVFRAIGSLNPMKTELTSDEMAQLISDVEKEGNAFRGEAVYRRSEIGCIKCHAIGGAGGLVGPDMVSLGASSPVDYIIESMLKPSAKIKEGYHTTTILTEEGAQLSGKVVSEDETKLVLRDAENKEVVIDVDSIEERQKSATSLMPVDLVAKVPRGDFVDLIKFLSSLGKQGPFKVPSKQYIRRWILDNGTTVYSKVDGSLPTSDIIGRAVIGEINVTTAGQVTLGVYDHEGLRITRDGATDNLRAARILQDLEVGKHRFRFQFNGSRTKPIRVEVLRGSIGRAVPVNQ